MLPLKRILCPTDFSPASLEGVKIAAEFAKESSAQLILVHVISLHPTFSASSPRTIMPSTELVAELEAAARESFEELLAQKYLESVNTKTVLIQGKTDEEIVKVSVDESADLIVISTHGASGWKKFLFGTVSERVIRLAEIPVMVIPKPD